VSVWCNNELSIPRSILDKVSSREQSAESKQSIKNDEQYSEIFSRVEKAAKNARIRYALLTAVCIRSEWD
jgi:hypothetical protein